MSNHVFLKSDEYLSSVITFQNPEPVARITPDGVMHFTVEASDENAKRFIECIDRMLMQMGRGNLQSLAVESR
jgi:hypothetical protein